MLGGTTPYLAQDQPCLLQVLSHYFSLLRFAPQSSQQQQQGNTISSDIDANSEQLEDVIAVRRLAASSCTDLAKVGISITYDSLYGS